MVRLLVADAQCIVRFGIKKLCRDMGDFSVEGEAASGDEALEVLSTANFDMMVLDPVLLGQWPANGSNKGGVNLINTIRARYANLPILLFGTDKTPETVNRMLCSGASGFLSRDSDRGNADDRPAQGLNRPELHLYGYRDGVDDKQVHGSQKQ